MKNTDKEPSHTSVDQNTLENLKMVHLTDKGLTHMMMETNMLENLKMVKNTDRELIQRQMEQLEKVSGKKIN